MKVESGRLLLLAASTTWHGRHLGGSAPWDQQQERVRNTVIGDLNPEQLGAAARPSWPGENVATSGEAVWFPGVSGRLTRLRNNLMKQLHFLKFRQSDRSHGVFERCFCVVSLDIRPSPQLVGANERYAACSLKNIPREQSIR